MSGTALGLPTVIYGGVISAKAAKLGAALPQGGSEPMLLRFCSAANVCQSVRQEEEEIDDPLNVDLRLAQFKQVMV